MHDARYWVETLDLTPYPQGGYFRETYRSGETLASAALPDRFGGSRAMATAIYFLLEAGQCSYFHRLKADEMWHFYAGDTLIVHRIDPGGQHHAVRLGGHPEQGDVFQAMVPAGCWFGAELAEGAAYALVGCTVAPGFDVADFKMGAREALLRQYPQHAALIRRLTQPVSPAGTQPPG